MANDYYATLGVARTASDDEIKKAFRRLAREHHPDANPQRLAEAERMMGEINQAYAVLSDPDKRARYDRFGAEGVNGDSDFGNVGNIGDLFEVFFSGMNGATAGRTREQIRRGSDVRADVTLTLEETFAGITKDLEIPTLLACETCEGSGAQPGTEVETCSACKGSGRLREVRSTFFGQFVQEAPCARCGGTGKFVPAPCTTCRGEGRVRSTRSLRVQIPAGVDEGDRVRVVGGGEDGAQGAPAGDLYCFITIEEHPQFQRRERDVLFPLSLSFPQAALGDTLRVPTLERDESGEIIYAEVSVPAATQNNALFRLSNKGFPDRYGRRGDQICVARITVPRDLTERQKELLREFAELSDEHPEEHPRGFFDKLKGVILGD